MAIGIEKVHDLFEINQETIELIKKKEGGATTKVINLIKSIEKTAENESTDPFLHSAAILRAKAGDWQAITSRITRCCEPMCHKMPCEHEFVQEEEAEEFAEALKKEIKEHRE